MIRCVCGGLVYICRQLCPVSHWYTNDTYLWNSYGCTGVVVPDHAALILPMGCLTATIYTITIPIHMHMQTHMHTCSYTWIHVTHMHAYIHSTHT